MLRPPSVAQNFLKLPGRSGMVTARIASRCSPSSASSAMKRRRSKLGFAPEAIATSVLFLDRGPDLAVSARPTLSPKGPEGRKRPPATLLPRHAVGEEPDLLEPDA